MTVTKLTGTFAHIIHSPRGGVEGLLLDVDDGVTQVVLDKDDEKNAALVSTLKSGQQLVLSTDDIPPSKKGPGAHPVRALRKLISVDGKTPPKPKGFTAGYSGTIVRLNYARHGAPNGFVLDSGDFIHVKPDGFAKLKLKVGDSVTAEDDAHFLSTGGGWAVEASSVNRTAVK